MGLFNHDWHSLMGLFDHDWHSLMGWPWLTQSDLMCRVSLLFQPWSSLNNERRHQAASCRQKQPNPCSRLTTEILRSQCSVSVHPSPVPDPTLYTHGTCCHPHLLSEKQNVMRSHKRYTKCFFDILRFWEKWKLEKKIFNLIHISLKSVIPTGSYDILKLMRCGSSISRKTRLKISAWMARESP